MEMIWFFFELMKLAMLTESGIAFDLGLLICQSTLPSSMNSFALMNVKKAQTNCHKQAFSQSIMMSIAVSSLGKRHWCLFSLEQKSAVLISYYCDIVLNEDLLPDIPELSGNNFTVQQDGVPAHCLRQTVAFCVIMCLIL